MNDLINDNILGILTENSRITMNDLGRRVNLSPPAVRERVKKLEEQGVIKYYTIDIDYKKLGYTIEMIVEIVIKNNRYDDFKAFVMNQKNIDFCYRISGEACYIFKVLFEDMEQVESFIDVLQPYGHTKSHLVFSTVKK
ncbi:Lrp/AsnC family transcriptional regulator [Macrococcoides goetzii]|nr:Lrp/AsnC family transcriptional regulator [Macrococcus goetzii]TDM45396.1 Lrp/AsnC family transcriptional regulator [Macrococcus goetzii]